MNLEHDFVQVSKFSEDHKKKRSSPKMEHFFSLNPSAHLRSNAHQSQIIGGIYPPRVSAPLATSFQW